jgi:hypothetical protein
MKEHPIYKGYLVSENGKVFTCRKRNGRNLANIDFSDPVEKSYYCDKDGYICTSVQFERKSKTVQVHRLVAETYIHNIKNLPQVNHIDENKKNNNIDNLEWVTAQRNVEHSKCKYIWEIQNLVTEEIFYAKNINLFCREKNLCESHLRRTFNTKSKHKKYKVLSRINFK